MAKTNPFDPTKNYSSILVDDAQEGWSKDFNHINSIHKDQRQKLSRQATGLSLVMRDSAGLVYTYDPTDLHPVVDMRKGGDFSTSGLYTFEALSSTTMRWKLNAGAWSSTVTVVSDNETWNIDVGGSGLDLIFRSTLSTDTFSIVKSDAHLVTGGSVSYDDTTGILTMHEAVLSAKGNSVPIPEQAISGVSAGDIIFLTLEETEIDFTTDAVLGHYLGDGEYHPYSPSAKMFTISLRRGVEASLPDDLETNIVVPLGQVSAIHAVGVFFPYLQSNLTLQDLGRELNPTALGREPATPTGFTWSSDAADLVGSIQGVTNTTNLSISCDNNTDGLTEEYEFKICFDYLEASPRKNHYLRVKHLSGEYPKVMLPSVVSGQEVSVAVRARGYDGKVSPWALASLLTTGGACSVSSLPSFTLEKAFDGFIVRDMTYGGYMSTIGGFIIRAKEGATPGVNSAYIERYIPFSGGLIEDRSLLIPWTGTNPYVTVEPYDSEGVRYGSATLASIDLTDCLIDPSYVGPTATATILTEGFLAVSLTGITSVMETVRVYAKMTGAPPGTNDDFMLEFPNDGSSAWFGKISVPAGNNWTVRGVGVDKFGVQNTGSIASSGIDLVTYITNYFEVAVGGKYYTDIQDAIDKIHALALTKAEIRIFPGTYVEDLTFPTGFACNLVIRGEDGVVIEGDVDYGDVGFQTGPASMGWAYESIPADWFLRIFDVVFEGHATRATQAPVGGDGYWAIFFKGCQFKASGSSTDELLNLVQHGDSHSNRMILGFSGCHFHNVNSCSQLILLSNGTEPYCGADFLFDSCTLSGTCSVALVTKEGSSPNPYDYVHEFRNCNMQNLNAAGLITQMNAYVVMTGNRMYTLSGSLFIVGQTTQLGRNIAGVSTDTNVVYSFPFLRVDH